MADPCSECREEPAVTATVTGRPVCQRCANRLQGAAAGTILGGPVQGIATGIAAENLTGLATAPGNGGGAGSSASEVLVAAEPFRFTLPWRGGRLCCQALCAMICLCFKSLISLHEKRSAIS